MGLTELSLVITAFAGLVTALTALIVALAKLWRASVERAATERQVRATLDAKNAELDALKDQCGKLWELLEGLTS